MAGGEGGKEERKNEEREHTEGYETQGGLTAGLVNNLSDQNKAALIVMVASNQVTLPAT